MYNITHRYLFLLLFIISTSLSFGNTPDFFTVVNDDVTWKSVLEKSKKEKKNIYTFATASWCGYCKLMEKNVFTDKQVQKYLSQNFICVELNGESQKGQSIMNKFQGNGFPTHLFIDENENLLGMTAGYLEIEPFLKECTNITENTKVLLELRKKKEKNALSPLETVKYIHVVCKTEGTNPECKTLAKDILDTISSQDLMNPAYEVLVQLFVNDIQSKHFKYLAKNDTLFLNTFGFETWNIFIGNAFNSNLEKAIRDKDEKILNLIADSLLVYYISDQELEESKFMIKKLYFGNSAQYEKYDSLVLSEAEKTTNLAAFFTREAMSTLESFEQVPPELINKALGWLSLIDESNIDFEVLIVKSYCYTLLTEIDNAKFWAQKAKDIAKTDEQNYEVSELLILLNEQK